MSEENKEENPEENKKVNIPIGKKEGPENPPSKEEESDIQEETPLHKAKKITTDLDVIKKQSIEAEGASLEDVEKHLNQRFKDSISEIWQILKQISLIRFFRYFGNYITPDALSRFFVKARDWLRKARDLIDIREGTDEYNTIKAIEDGIEIKGYNIWILMASAMLASIGLDVNSGAVIIGAMLISPLMNPILGVGLGLGINDWNMSRHALQNLAIAVAVSILTSVIYFWITPFGDATEEIVARTEPTLLDVFVAIFGGVAGIVSNSRYEKTNAIPGVAIATALMPPICVSGFGLATFDLSVFLGAFYLFFINAVFISISTFVMVRYFGFEPCTSTDKRTRRKIGLGMLIISLILVIPSVWFLISLYNKSQETQKIEELVIQPINQDPIYEVIEQKRDNGHIKLYLSAENEMPDSLQDKYRLALLENGVTDTLEISRVNISKEEIEKLNADIATGVVNLEKRFATIENRFDSLKMIQSILDEQAELKRWQDTLTAELRIFFEDLITITEIKGWNPPKFEQKLEEEKEEIEVADKKEEIIAKAEEAKSTWQRALILTELLPKPKFTIAEVWFLGSLFSKLQEIEIKEQENAQLEEEAEITQETDSTTNTGKRLVAVEMKWMGEVPDSLKTQQIKKFLALKMNLDIINDTISIDTLSRDSITIEGDTLLIKYPKYNIETSRDSLQLEPFIKPVAIKEEEK